MSALPSLLVLVLFAAPSAAIISRQHFDRARHAFAQHDYRHALDDFIAASETATTELPDLWFDIAQCHRNLGHARQAVLAFQHYLVLRPEAPDRAKVEAMIVQLGGPPPAPPAQDPPPPDPPSPPTSASATTPDPIVAPAPIATTPAATAAPLPSLTNATAATTTATTTVTDPLGSPALQLTVPAAPPPKPRHRRWVVWTAVAGGVAVSALAIGLGVGLGLDNHASLTASSPQAPMLGSAATFDTRGR